MDAGRARFRFEARLPEPLDKGLAVATDVDPEPVRGSGQEIVQVPGGDLMSAVEDHNVFADCLDVGQEVARQDDVTTWGTRDRAHQVEHFRPAPRVQTRRGLIEDVQLRVVHHGLSELHLLLHARRVLRDLAVALFLDPDELQHVMRAADRTVRVEPAHAAHEGDEADARHIRDQAIMLGHVADALAQRHAVEDVAAEDLRGSRGGLEEAQEQPEERRLAGAVWADESDRSLRNRDGKVVDGADFAEHLGEVLSLNEHDRPLHRTPEHRPGQAAMPVVGFETFGVARTRSRGWSPPRPR